jgi:hypothetical protein
MDRSALDAELIRDEEQVLYLYDDANGKRIVRGYTVLGTPTICVGINATFFDAEESIWLLHHRQDIAIAALTKAFPPFAALDDVRQRALTNLYFNVPAFLHWTNFMAFCNSANWSAAAADLETTHPWIDQVGARGLRIAGMLRAGTPA